MVSSGYDNNDNNQRGLLFFFGASDCILIYCTLHIHFLMKHSNAAATLKTCAIMQTQIILWIVAKYILLWAAQWCNC